MPFLGGLLKFLAIVLLLAATAGCTALSVMAGRTDVYWIMGAVWFGILLVVLHLWGTGLALTEVHKLRKQLAHYQHRGESASEEMPAAKATGSSGKYVGRYNSGSTSSAKGSSGKSLLIIALVVLALAVVIAAFLFLRSNSPVVQDKAMPDPQQVMVPETIYLPVEIPTEAPAETAAPEAPAPASAESISLGNSASTDFVDMRFEDCVIKKDIKLSVTTGHVTRTTGPDPLPGQRYICLTGKIKNTHSSALPVYDFFLGRFDIDGYTYDLRANDCDILTPDGQTVSKIEPLMEYDFRIFTAIPDELANSHSSCTFTFGFYDLFENSELSASAAFSDNPIAECPYQYTITIR